MQWDKIKPPLTGFCRSGEDAEEWCRRNLILFHLADEQRGADLVNVLPYRWFRAVFKMYHLPGVSDYSYLAYDMLRQLGYTTEELDFAGPQIVDQASQSQEMLPYAVIAEKRINAAAADF